jgi:hypothetical protein
MGQRTMRCRSMVAPLSCGGKTSFPARDISLHSVSKCSGCERGGVVSLSWAALDSQSLGLGGAAALVAAAALPFVDLRPDPPGVAVAPSEGFCV